MGRSTKKIDPLVSPPRNVWDRSGHLMGTFFPTSKLLRLQDGEVLHIDSHNRIRKSNGSTAVLNLDTFVILTSGSDAEN